MKRLFYNFLFLVGFTVYFPVFVVRLFRRGGVDRQYWERFGIYTRARKDRLRQLQNPVWIHAVSVGEVVAAITFIQRWKEDRPELNFVLSTTTTTGHMTADSKLPDDVPLIYCPLDFRSAVRTALRLIDPRMLVIFEVEIWPNLIAETHSRGCPVALVNGRVSDRSSRGYAKHRWFFNDIFQRFSVICVQAEQDSERIRRIVGDSVPVKLCNTMKFDQIADLDQSDRGELLAACFGGGGRLIWTAGSTHPGEEELICAEYRKLKEEFSGLRLILVPRHHERTVEVEEVLDRMQLTYRLFCSDGSEDSSEGGVDVLVVNTTGELMSFYACADLVYVGKSLAGNCGGHNIIEPAIFGKPILHGSQMQNFREVAGIFRDAEAAVEVAGDSELGPAVAELLRDSEARDALGRRARATVEEQRGAIDLTLACLNPHIP